MKIVLMVEPSKQLSKDLGFPYLILTEFYSEELLEQGIIDQEDIERLQRGETLEKALPLR